MSIQGSKKSKLTKESILLLISPYDIYRRYFGNFKINVACCNHLRGDRNPSFVIGTKYKELSHFDFSDGKWCGDCFSFVQQVHSCDYDTALKIIDRDFGLNISQKGNLEYKKIINEYKQPEELEKKYSIIQCITRAFTLEELEYWNSYGIDKQELIDNNIYSIKKLYLNKQLFSLRETELRFGYLYEGKYWKLYRPFNSKETKWGPNNVPSTIMDGKECIKDCNVALISKSKKDFLVIRKIFPCSCAVQSESIGCFSKENVEYLKNNSNKQILSFDSDIAGVKNSLQITKLFNFGYINVPKLYLTEGINDWSDLSRAHGIQTIEKIFKNKNLI